MNNRIITNPELFRASVQEKLSSYFDTDKDAVNLEKGIYNWTIKESSNKKIIKKWDNSFFVRIYIDHLKSVYFNLNRDDYLSSLVQNGEIKSQDIAFMTHQEMDPKKWESLIAAKSIRDKNKFEQRLEAMTDTLTCRKCFSKKCSYYAMQTRSSDEPMTIFASCLECGKRWKQ